MADDMKEYLRESVIPKLMEALQVYNKEDIEDTIIAMYTDSALCPGGNQIKEIVTQFSIDLDMEAVIYIFEALLEKENIIENGIVFTPEYIASFIVKNVFDNVSEWSEKLRIIDPGCGCGIFLITAIEYLKNRFHVRVKDIVLNNIYGIDLEPDNVRRCKKIMKMLVTLDGDEISESEISVINANSLKQNWNKTFHAEGFDFIIGNPPYVNTHDMNNETILFLKENFKTTQTGVFNIFYAFIEHGMQYLKTSGKMSFIVPNNFMTIKSALNLRNYIQSNKALKQIIDFTDNMVFKPIRTYNCIIVLDKAENQAFQYAVLKKSDYPERLLERIEYNTMPLMRLDKNGWNLVDKKTYENLMKIENQVQTIKDFIRTGIATLRDNIYMVSKSEQGFYKIVDETRYEIDSGLVKTIYKIPELKKGERLEDVCRYIIFPYIECEQGYKIIPENILREQYSDTYRYLWSRKEELDSRDKGKGNPVAWYAYGRTQRLNRYGKKLLFPTFTNRPKFMLVKDEEALFCNGYGIFENEYLDLEELMAVLNSKVMEYYVANTSYAIEGGYYCYQKKYIERFSIPEFDEDERKLLRTGNRQEVDEMLLEKYDLVI